MILIYNYLKKHKNYECLSLNIFNDLPKINISKNGKLKISLLLTNIKSLIPKIKKPIQEIILKIYDKLGLNSIENPNFKEELLLLQKFHSLAQEYANSEYPDISSFIYHLGIINKLNIQIESLEMEKSGIRIMTNHTTKGLEYESVIVSNLAQKRFPMEKRNNSLIP